MDAQKNLYDLLKKKNGGIIEHINGFTEKAFLSYVACSFKGSTKVSRQYNDLSFWDSTHNTTTYVYKLSSFRIVDCESKIIQYCLTLVCKRMLRSSVV